MYIFAPIHVVCVVVVTVVVFVVKTNLTKWSTFIRVLHSLVFGGRILVVQNLLAKPLLPVIIFEYYIWLYNNVCERHGNQICLSV